MSPGAHRGQGQARTVPFRTVRFCDPPPSGRTVCPSRFASLLALCCQHFRRPAKRRSRLLLGLHDAGGAGCAQGLHAHSSSAGAASGQMLCDASRSWITTPCTDTSRLRSVVNQSLIPLSFRLTPATVCRSYIGTCCSTSVPDRHGQPRCLR